jgi:putative DNA primase/helicase
MRDLASPVAAFVRELCTVKLGLEASVDGIYKAFKDWAEVNGHRIISKQTFGRNLRAAVPSVQIKRPRNDDDANVRYRAYVGIGLKVYSYYA